MSRSVMVKAHPRRRPERAPEFAKVHDQLAAAYQRDQRNWLDRLAEERAMEQIAEELCAELDKLDLKNTRHVASLDRERV